MKKIEFENKQNSLDINGKYVISSNDINEIKLVVNSLITDIVDEEFKINSLFRYLRIQLPKNIGTDKNISLNVIFKNEIDEVILDSINNIDEFLIFKDSKFINLSQYNNGVFTSIDKNSIILIKTPQNLNFENLDVSCKFIINENIEKNVSHGYSAFKETSVYPWDSIFLYRIGSNDYETLSNSYKNKLIPPLLNLQYTYDDIITIKNNIGSWEYWELDDRPENELYYRDPYWNESAEINFNNFFNYKNKTKIINFRSSFFLGQGFNNSDPMGITSGPDLQFIVFPTENITEVILENYSSLKNSQCNIYEKYDRCNYELGIKQSLTPHDLIKNVYFIDSQLDKVYCSFDYYDYIRYYDEFITHPEHNYYDTNAEYIVRVKKPFINRLEIEFDKDTLTNFDNFLTYSGKIYYNNGDVEDFSNIKITNTSNNGNGDVFDSFLRFYSNYNSNINYLYIDHSDQDNDKIFVKNIKYDETKYVKFSIPSRRGTPGGWTSLDSSNYSSEEEIYCIKEIKLVNAAALNVSGKLITSSNDNANKYEFSSNGVNFKDVESAIINDISEINQLKTTKLVDVFEINKSFPTNTDVNLNEFINNNYNLYYEADVYVDINGNEVFVRTCKLPNSLMLDANKNYKIKYYNVSARDGAKFIKNYIIPVNYNFKNEYVIAFQNLKMNVTETDLSYKTYGELLKVAGTFENDGIEREFDFIYDSTYDTWLITDVPLKMKKLKHLTVSFSYIKDLADFTTN